MSRHWTEKFNKIPSSKRPIMQVFHGRNEPDKHGHRHYNGKTTCILSYIDKNKKPRSIIATVSRHVKETRAMCKRFGFKIATERAIKEFFNKNIPVAERKTRQI